MEWLIVFFLLLDEPSPRVLAMSPWWWIPAQVAVFVGIVGVLMLVASVGEWLEGEELEETDGL